MRPDAAAADVVLTPRQVGRLLATSGLAPAEQHRTDDALAQLRARATELERLLGRH